MARSALQSAADAPIASPSRRMCGKIRTLSASMSSCAIIGIWSAIGYDLVLILAGLQSISRSYYEAAEIDGANGIQTFFHITIPMVSPTLFFVVLMRAMSSLKQFDTIYLLINTRNPAYKSATVLMTLFYREAFEKFNKGYGSAIVHFCDHCDLYGSSVYCRKEAGPL